MVPITAAIIFVAWRTQSEEPVITLAELPVEDEVTFDLETNPVYSSEDGIVVIPASEIGRAHV